MTPRWLTVTQARRYCPLGEKRLVELVKSGRVRGCQNPGDKRHTWIIDRESLDRYFEVAGKVDIDVLKRIGL